MNWAEVLYGDIKSLKENKIKALKLKKGDKILRSVNVISENSILVKDSLTEVCFEFDHKYKLIAIKSVKGKTKEEFGLSFRNSLVNGISRSVEEKGLTIYNRFSKVYFHNISYEEKETYSFDQEKNDSLHVFRTRYFFNDRNPGLSYKETYQDGRTFGKKYFNGIEVWKTKFEGYYTVDSILQKDNKPLKYYFENHPDHQIIRIKKDSILTVNKKSGKKVHEKLEYMNLPFKEIFYDENENIREKIIYQNYKNPFNEWILWEERRYDKNGKLINKKLPNKNNYKLKNGVLIFRKNVSGIRNIDDQITMGTPKHPKYYHVQSYSPSLLFIPELSTRYIQNFDTSSVPENSEMIYIDIKFQDDDEVISEYSASKDVKEEGIRTSEVTRKYTRRYFKDLEVETETAAGKKYKINLSEKSDFLSFPIHTFLIEE